MSDIDIAVVDSLKVLDPKWPIREADMLCPTSNRRLCQPDILGRCREQVSSYWKR